MVSVFIVLVVLGGLVIWLSFNMGKAYTEEEINEQIKKNWEEYSKRIKQ